jgi:hypothetical protein
LNDPVWDVMEDDAMGVGTGGGKRVSRREVVDAGRTQLRSLNRLDVEMNEILSQV